MQYPRRDVVLKSTSQPALRTPQLSVFSPKSYDEEVCGTRSCPCDLHAERSESFLQPEARHTRRDDVRELDVHLREAGAATLGGNLNLKHSETTSIELAR